MSVSTTLNFATLEDLYLDPQNPRLGRHNINNNLSQEELLEVMRTWTLEELALSYLESGGFWTHEALIVVREPLYDSDDLKLVVVEGNRRLAALKYLKRAFDGSPVSKKWEQIVQDTFPPENLFSQIPFLIAESREDIYAFLGFRHVTGIKQWGADEKAGYIAKLIEEEGLSYEQVMRKIGSKTPTVRQLYIAYRTLLQIEETIEEFESQFADRRFAVLYMTLRTEGARQYLDINIFGDPEQVRNPVPDERLNELKNFSLWLFGTNDIEPIVTDTRQVSRFGKVLESSEALEYLKNASRPNLEIAYRRAGGDVAEIIDYLEKAAENLESALSRAHLYQESTELKELIQRVTLDATRLASIFPEIYEQLCGGAE